LGSTVNTLYFNDLGFVNYVTNINLDTFLDSLYAGTTITIVNPANNNTWVYQVNTNSVDSGTYHTISVTYVSGPTASISNNQLLYFSFQLVGGPAGTSGTSGTSASSVTDPFQLTAAEIGSAFFSSSYFEWQTQSMLTASVDNYSAFFIDYQIYDLNTANEESEMITGTYTVGFTKNGLYSEKNSTVLMFNGPDSNPVSGSNLFPATYLSASYNAGPAPGFGKIEVKFKNDQQSPPQRRYISYTYRLLKRTALT
jgi:hypothetical protein